MEGSIAQIQDQEPFWKRQLTSRPTIEFDRDAIALIFKVKIAIEDWCGL